MPKPVDLNQPGANSASRIRNPQLGRKANALLDPKTERFEFFPYPTATPMCGNLLVAKATFKAESAACGAVKETSPERCQSLVLAPRPTVPLD